MAVGEKFESSNKEFAIDFRCLSSSSSFYRTESLIPRKFTKLGYLLLSSLSFPPFFTLFYNENTINESPEI